MFVAPDCAERHTSADQRVGIFTIDIFKIVKDHSNCFDKKTKQNVCYKISTIFVLFA